MSEENTRVFELEAERDELRAQVAKMLGQCLDLRCQLQEARAVIAEGERTHWERLLALQVSRHKASLLSTEHGVQSGGRL